MVKSIFLYCNTSHCKKTLVKQHSWIMICLINSCVSCQIQTLTELGFAITSYDSYRGYLQKWYWKFQEIIQNHRGFIFTEWNFEKLSDDFVISYYCDHLINIIKLWYNYFSNTLSNQLNQELHCHTIREVYVYTNVLETYQ